MFLAECKERDLDSGQMFRDNPTNPPIGIIRLVRSPVKLQEWDGTIWQDRPLAIEGGGTGGSNQSAARAGLGLGTISTQNANAVAITGGTLAAISSLQVSGTISVSADNAFDIGGYTAQFRRGYFKSAFVLPVGVDKYATS